MQNKSLLLVLFVLFITMVSGCVTTRAPKQATGAATSDGMISVLSLRGDTSSMTQDQIVELQRVGTWMDRDIIKQLKRVGYSAKLLKSRRDFSGAGHLLIIDVDKFNPGNRAARVFVGFGAGAASLDLDYQLINSRNKRVAQWKDGVGSSKGGTYCAQTLNRNAIEQLKGKL
ncbi:MAG: hypothetical protein BA870_12235 [Desulfuromonadales bacterium C00003094]|nr:MAG: hypothetical protein BA870_12235 [Desulfuromonadales bacterium C00003094]OEU72659.1 MAG: hypothetical protein BA869_01605 [Desulfuromonadales bacterium C00003107]